VKKKRRYIECLITLALAASGLTNVFALSDQKTAGIRPATLVRAADAEGVALTLYYPRLAISKENGVPADDSQYTGISVTNLSDTKATLTFTAYDETGTPMTGPDLANPASLELEPGQQLTVIDTQLFGLGMTGQDPVGWIEVESDVPEVVAAFTSFDGNQSMLEESAVSSNASTEFVLPEIEEQGFTQVQIANPDSNPATVAFQLLQADGNYRVPPVSRTIPGNGALAEDVANLFPGVSLSGSDYIRVSSDKGVVPSEYVGQPTHDVYGLNGQDATAGATTLYAPQYAVGSDWASSLSVVNLDSQPGNVTFKLMSDDGTQIGNTQVMPIEAFGKIYVEDSSFFLDPGDNLIQGYLQITSDGVRLTGSIVFADDANGTSALALLSNLQTTMVFNQVSSNTGYFTGITLVNPQEADAHATLEVFDQNGQLLISKAEVIGGNQRESRLFSEYFPELAGTNITSGYIKVTSDQGLAGFAILGTTDLSALSAVTPQSVR